MALNYYRVGDRCPECVSVHAESTAVIISFDNLNDEYVCKDKDDDHERHETFALRMYAEADMRARFGRRGHGSPCPVCPSDMITTVDFVRWSFNCRTKPHSMLELRPKLEQAPPKPLRKIVGKCYKCGGAITYRGLNEVDHFSVERDATCR